LYLKQRQLGDGCHYILCESYPDEGFWKHRELRDLGLDPGAHIEYFGDSGFCIKEALEEDVQQKADTYSSEELEDVFKPFLRPHIRRVVEMFEEKRRRPSRWHGCSREKLLEHQRTLHSFDKRRLHFLRCGRVNIGNLDARPWKFLNVLLEKSRDEIEHVINDMERILALHELRPYLYTALHLQTYFSYMLTRHHPEALDPEKVDRYFVEELCRLNADETFFRGVERHDWSSLHPYLVKYVILYFDHAFDPGSLRREYVDDFVWRHRFHKPPPPSGKTAVSERQACQALGISRQDFRRMDREELTRCYRRRAKSTHPDTGGDEETFVELKEAYESLLVRKP
jgi:hypothetical protein